MGELERITEKKGLKESTRSTWKEIAPKILSQARLESHCRGVDSALQVIKDCEGMCMCVCICVVNMYVYISPATMLCVGQAG